MVCVCGERYCGDDHWAAHDKHGWPGERRASSCEGENLGRLQGGAKGTGQAIGEGPRGEVGSRRHTVRPRLTHALAPTIQHQVEEYVAWVNSHLKKRTGSPLIYDLRSLQDGVTLVSLAEVLSKLIQSHARPVL